MPRVTFTPHLRKHLQCRDGRAAGSTVREAMESVFASQPALRGYLLDDQGRLRQHVAIFIGDRMIGDRLNQSDPVGEESEIYIFQALSGG